MPILPPEAALFPDSLLAGENPPFVNSGRDWWALHVRPRQEKGLARQLCDRGVPFYLPLVSRRSPVRGRVRTSFVPLFPGYVFLFAGPDERTDALSTNRVVRALAVPDQEELWHDLRQLYQLLASGVPVQPEGRLTAGAAVEVTSGPLAGLRGKVLRAASGRRFVVEVNFLQRGASVLLDEAALRPAGPA